MATPESTLQELSVLRTLGDIDLAIIFNRDVDRGYPDVRVPQALDKTKLNLRFEVIPCISTIVPRSR